MSSVPPSIPALKADIKKLVKVVKSAGVPTKLIGSIKTKCLRTPRRQTGRIERRTNRHPRWSIAPDHPDYAPEVEAHLVLLRLLVEMLLMENAPIVDRELLKTLFKTYLGVALPEGPIKDPVTDEVFDFRELVNDVAHKPQHGYSKFHIGHQDPRFHPKHLHLNVRWQLKSSNDFQKTMDSRVARIAYMIDCYTRTRQQELFDNAVAELSVLPFELAKTTTP
jgi:hypothetical protein